MPESRLVKVKDLSLDLANFRTVQQKDEKSAVEAMISTSPDRFWALAESILQDGYLPTETVIVLSDGGARPKLTVREGNRRVAVLKLFLGQLTIQRSLLPADFVEKSKNISSAWRKANEAVPCSIYEPKDAATVDRIVTLAHGKGEKAGRDQWNAVARARHSRDVNKEAEPALDLLEKYLDKGRNATEEQKTRWAGVFPLSVLDEAMKKLAPRLDVANAPELASKYPDVKHRQALDEMIRDVGLETLRFDTIRNKDVDFALKYGLAPIEPPKPKTGHPADKGPKPKTPKKPTTPSQPPGKRPDKSLPTNDPKAVRRALRDFAPRGKKREKVAALKKEAAALDLNETPLAFCFVLRSMFEISAKAYCNDHAADGLKTTKADGSDRPLVEVLRSIVDHLTKANLPKPQQDKEKVKVLHGAMTELAKATGLLSVTSMNQLVHNQRFSVAPSDIAISFFNMFPLLEEMNS